LNLVERKAGTFGDNDRVNVMSQGISCYFHLLFFPSLFSPFSPDFFPLLFVEIEDIPEHFEQFHCRRHLPVLLHDIGIRCCPFNDVESLARFLLCRNPDLSSDAVSHCANIRSPPE
jgi:hypothetical protein